LPQEQHRLQVLEEFAEQHHFAAQELVLALEQQQVQPWKQVEQR
jgi:hypothetical protein